MSYSQLTRSSPNASSMSASNIGEQEIELAIGKHGVTPGGSIMMKKEAEAANESIASGIYCSWTPDPSCTLTQAAYEGIQNGTSQCCRVGSKSVCLCGHSLARHEPVKLRSGYIKPPTCQNCRCQNFSYCPERPEECGQWWLPRRKEFVLKEWQQRIREKPAEYCCLGCDQKVSDHETVFESRDTRKQRGAAVDGAYIPLSDNRYLTEQVIEGKGRIGGRTRAPPTKTPSITNGPRISEIDDYDRSPFSKVDTNESTIFPTQRTTPYRK